MKTLLILGILTLVNKFVRVLFTDGKELYKFNKLLSLTTGHFKNKKNS